MKRKIFNLILVILFLFSLIGCGTISETPVTPPQNNLGENGNENEGSKDPGDDSGNNDNEDDDPIVELVDYQVTLTYNDRIFIPKETINVYWVDEYSQYSQGIDSEGYAKIKLDGEFNVYLDKAPDGYSYNPNIYTANNDAPIIEIELSKVAKPSRGRGTALYNEYEISSDGVYRTELTSKTKKVYYEYEPKAAGYYVIESLVNIYEDNINPKVDIYDGTAHFKNFRETLDTGGLSKKGGYTKNIKWVVQVSQEQLSSVFTFAIYAESKTGKYPVYVDFKISYEGEYYIGNIVSKLMVAKEANTKALESSKVYRNSDHGTGSYYAGRTNGTGILDGNDYKYNEETGFFHLYDSNTNTYGPILCAKITKPCAYYEEALSLIESHGNKNLTVSNGTENYKQFIENQYASVCNSDGVCYVTMELKEFLQKFSISQRLFLDGNGFVESTGVYAVEEDQWLFACGYYEE